MTTKTVTEHNVVRQDIMVALFDCIENAPIKNQEALATALEAYSLRYDRSYKGLRNGAPFLQDLIRVMEEASCTRIDQDDFDRYVAGDRR
jgi:hypothetical protein